MHEYIDLATLDALLESVRQLKRELALVQAQLKTATEERQNLSAQIKQKESQYQTDRQQLQTRAQNELNALISKHQNEISTLTKNSEDAISQLKIKHQQAETAMTTHYEKTIKNLEKKLGDRIEQLENSLATVSRENQAMLNRIRGINA